MNTCTSAVKPDRARWLSSRNFLVAFAAALFAIATVRVVSTYHVLSQAADEPATIAAGMEWLDKGTYQVDPLHPPLARVASAIGPYLHGLRFPTEDEIAKGPNTEIFFKVGDVILNEGGNYWHSLALARLGMLPFLAVGVLTVLLWAREIGGDLAAIFGIVFFTTLPPILAFTGFAYTDMPVGVLVAASTLVFAHWLERPSAQNSILLGIVAGLTLLSKFTTLLFLPTCWFAVVCCWFAFGPKEQRNWRLRGSRILWAALLFLVVVWGGYRFSFAPLSSVYARPEHDIWALHLPGPATRVLLKSVNLPVPAPAFFRGLSWNFQFDVQGRQSYLLGDVRHGGWWYFFVVAIGVKTPLAMLLLAILGGWMSFSDAWKKRDWRLAVPAACAFAILLSSMPVKVNYGVRHILCIYPFLTIVAGYGAATLWHRRTHWRLLSRAALVLLLAWELISTARIHPDYVTYFNELAGRHPEKVLLWGCDFDCGQDIGRLAQATQQRHIDHLAVAIFGNNDFSQMGLPPVEKLQPYQTATGWVAASIREIDTGNTFMGLDTRLDAYRWVTTCQPVERVGRTIYLYYFPCGNGTQPKGPL
jgi:Dolichyl-phosphate-mannose-protein mannosyltransferase